MFVIAFLEDNYWQGSECQITHFFLNEKEAAAKFVKYPKRSDRDDVRRLYQVEEKQYYGSFCKYKDISHKYDKKRKFRARICDFEKKFEIVKRAYKKRRKIFIKMKECEERLVTHFKLKCLIKYLRE